MPKTMIEPKLPARQTLPSMVLKLLLLALLLSACSTRPYIGSDINSASFLTRAITQEQGDIRVSAAVPDAQETKALIGLDLYEQGIQPVWLEVENKSEVRARASLWSADRDYFSPIEVAYMNRGEFSKQGYADMERWFYETGMDRHIPAGETRSGLIFTNLKPGTKAFNFDVLSTRRSYNFTFFVPMPGFTADYTDVDFTHLYDGEDIRQMSQEELQTFLETELPCCATDDTGELMGAPLNVVLVGSGLSVRRTMMRGDWRESPAGWRENAAVREQYFEGRKADAVFYRLREDGDEQIEVRLWLSPWEVDSQRVWVGQAFYSINNQNFWQELTEKSLLKDSNSLATYMEQNIAADIDSAQNFTLQNFWYNHSLAQLGMTRGIPASTTANPGHSYNGVAYFTTGYRVIMFLSEQPNAVDEVKLIYKRRPAAAQGDTDA